MTDSRARFGSRADDYAAYRPSHASEAVDAVLEGLGDPGKLVIADVGAGTGLSSHLFAARGANVIAIEPNASMRAKAEHHARIAWRDASAEATGLSDKSVDVVVACQAFHWFATPQAMAEFVRIARRRTAMLQYERDESDSFTAAYGEIVRVHTTDDTEEMRRRGLLVFESFPRARLACSAKSTHRLDLQALLGRAASSSYLPASGEMGERLAEDLRALFERFQTNGYVTMHLVTYALTADLE
jgi:ubiquinone/menaquinone biosynthesis C-methylase UbiE